MPATKKTSRELFDAAVEIDDPELRRQFIEQACGADPSLKDRVEDLLRAHHAAGRFFQGPGTPRHSHTAEGLPSERLGRYKLLQKLGEGGCGVVYMAEQTDPVKRRVALKIIKLGMDTRSVIARFEAERQALALMDHPNIARVFDAGATETGRPFFVMELVRGVPITDFCDQNNLTTRERLALFVQVCQAVQHAHQKGIIHRDLKPSNILVAPRDGQTPVACPKVIDFGIAKATTDLQLTDKTVFTQFELLVGTPAYMSPEQAEGTVLDVDTRSDIYSLGVLLYELLTGHTPFDTQNLLKSGLDAMRRTIRETEPPRPSTRLRSLAANQLTEVARRRRSEPLKLVSLLRGDLDWIVLKSLEKDRTRRYETANALAADVGRHLVDEPVVARPPSPLYLLRKLIRRNRALASAAVIVLLALAAGFSVSTLMFVRERDARREADRARIEESRQRAAANEKTAESLRRLVRLNVVSGNKLVEEGDSFGALLWFTEALRLDQGDPAREDVHRRRLAAVRRTAPTLEQLWYHESILNWAEFSPAGDRILTAGRDDIGRVWDTTTGQLLPLDLQPGWTTIFRPRFPGLVIIDDARALRLWEAGTSTRTIRPEPLSFDDSSRMTVSPDGRWLVIPGGQGVQLIAVTPGQPDVSLRSVHPMQAVSFNADGSRLAAIGKHRWVEIWEIPSGAPVGQPLEHAGQVNHVDLSPDGLRLASATARELQVWDVARGVPLWPRIEPGGDLYSCRISPNGEWLVTSSWNGFARTYDAATGRPLGDSMPHRGGVGKAIICPNGRWVATASWDGTARIWDPRTGKPASPALWHASFVTAVDFNADSSRLLTSGQDGMVRLWHLPTNHPARLELPHQAAVSRAAFSPDGRLILTCSADGTARLWEAGTGQPVLSMAHQAPILDGQFSPDGKQIATAGGNSFVRLWETGTGRETVPPIRLPGVANRVSFSPDGRKLASAGQDGSARVWDALTGHPLSPPLAHGSNVVQASFSPDGRRIVTASLDSTGRIWDAVSGEPLGAILTNACSLSFAAFSPDGRSVVTACSDATQLGRSARIWNSSTGLPAGPPMPHLDGVFQAEFSPDGRYVATASEDRSAVIWDAASSARLTASMQHGSYVLRVAFSPDSRFLLTVSFDGTARVWESATGEPVTPPLVHGGRVVSGAWSPDGRQVITACVDGLARVWDVAPTDATVSELQRDARILSAHQLESDLGTLPLTAEQLHRLWRESKSAR